MIDTMIFHEEGLRHLIAEVGVNQIVYGTDYPFDWPIGIDFVLNAPDRPPTPTPPTATGTGRDATGRAGHAEHPGTTRSRARDAKREVLPPRSVATPATRLVPAGTGPGLGFVLEARETATRRTSASRHPFISVTVLSLFYPFRSPPQLEIPTPRSTSGVARFLPARLFCGGSSKLLKTLLQIGANSRGIATFRRRV